MGPLNRVFQLVQQGLPLIRIAGIAISAQGASFFARRRPALSSRRIDGPPVFQAVVLVNRRWPSMRACGVERFSAQHC